MKIDPTRLDVSFAEPVIDKGLDYSFARPDLNILKSLGYTVAFRYLPTVAVAEQALSPKSLKSITAPEVSRLHAADFGIVLMYEQTALDALAGYTAGVRAGRIARENADILHYPEHLPIVVCCDTNITGSTVGVAVDYLRGFDEGSQTPAGANGLYSDTDLMNARPSALNVLPMAFAWSPVPAKATVHAQQKRSPNPQYDLDLITHTFPVWTKEREVTFMPVPNPVVPTAVLVTVAGFDNVFLVGANMPAINITPELFTYYATEVKLPQIKTAVHQQFLAGLLTQAGLTISALVPSK